MAAPPPKRRIEASDIPGAPDWLGGLLGPVNGFIRSVAAALEHGLTRKENFSGEVRTLTFTTPDDWVPLTASDMRNSWQLYPSNAAPTLAYRLAVRKSLRGEVEVRGLAIPPAVGTLGVAFAWPEGYAPYQEEIFALRGEQQVVEVRAKTTGADVTARVLDAGAPPQGWVSFSGMRFDTADRTPPRWEKPLDVKLGTEQRPFPGKVGSVEVLSCQQQGALTAPAVIVAIDWTPLVTDTRKGTPGVRIHRVWGLLPNTAYTLTIFIAPE